MQALQFETIDLDQLEQVAGGGKIWRKFKHAVKHWASDVSEALLHSVEEGIHAGGNTNEEMSDFGVETQTELGGRE